MRSLHCLFVLGATYISLADAFLPGPLFWGITPWNTISHAKQTELAVHAFVKEHFKMSFGPFDWLIPTTIKSARDTIIAANEQVDSPKSPFNEKDYGPAHFDDELFQKGQDHLMTLRAEMIQFLEKGDAHNARVWLGRQLHTLQDFYSHSNWVEQNPGRTDTSPIIGRPGAVPPPPATKPTCKDTCLDGVPKDSRQTLIYLEDATKCFRDCFQGDQTTGQLAATRVCAALCKDPDEFCREEKLCKNNICESNIINTAELTTGYYLVEGVDASYKPTGKCSHGGINDDGAWGIEGINKDSSLEYYAPHHFLHRKAAELGQKATEEYLNYLKTDWKTVVAKGLETKQPALTEKQLRLLFGVGASTLAFVIDTTGSMGDVIRSVQTTAVSIVNGIKGSENEPTSYVLMGYNDPVGRNLIATTEADQFIAVLNSLSAFGGGDCPEPALTAINKTLDMVDVNSNIFLFTDAQPSDTSVWSTTVKNAKEKNARITVFQFPSGCPSETHYRSLAQRTSGRYLKLTSRAATPALVDIAINQIGPKFVNIYDDVPAALALPLRRRAPAVTDILVESAMETLTIIATGPDAISIAKPDGSALGTSDPGVTFLTLADLTHVIVKTPAPGTWKITRTNTATTGLSVSGASFLSFNSFQFVELGGSHPGYFPIDSTTLVPGSTYTAKADLEGDYTSAAFQFRAQDTGAILNQFEMTRMVGPEDLPPDHIWYGNVTTPTCGAYYAYVVGKDGAGAPFQRYFASVYGTAGNCSTGSVTSSATGSAPTSTTGKWNATSSSHPATSKCPGGCGGQGVSMTETVM
jgi:hypothetical protein